MTPQPQLSDSALIILMYLAGTRSKTQRTRKVISDRCHMTNDPQRCDQAIKQLINAGLLNVCEGGSHYELSEVGLRVAREESASPKVVQIIENVNNGATVTLQGTDRAPHPSLNGSGDHQNGNGKHTKMLPALKAPGEAHNSMRAIEETIRITWDEYTDYRHHPLRLTDANTKAARPHDPLDRSTPPPDEVHFLLAFYDKRDQQPFAVMHGDVIGRAPTSNVMLRNDGYISGNHCRFELRLERNTITLWIEDMQSANGTAIDGKPIPPGKLTPLKPGNIITIGRTNLVVVQVIYKAR